MAFIIAHMGGLDRINRRPRDYKARRTLADVCEREINNYRFPREHIRELITQYEASAFANTSTRGHAIPAETEVRAFTYVHAGLYYSHMLIHSLFTQIVVTNCYER